ncbi:MAG TPA: Gfo/Idh/MocA family oxidoreductase [Clostridia bacterium]|nr:Gfo/Idh/MocA family oxidoreductase [Clostridia bacterium]
MAGKLKIGIIGCGGIARQKHLPALSKLSAKCEIVAFCDIIEERAISAQKEFGTPGSRTYTDYHELLKDESIDVVHVLTPNVAHAPITIDAFAAGKHVMCEKPMAHNTEMAAQMMDAWKKSGKMFTIGYQNRFNPILQSLYATCNDGYLGDIYFAKAHAVRRRAVPTWGVFQDKSKQGGGPLIDIGTHALDMTLWCMNNYEPMSVSGTWFHKMADQTDGNMFGPWDPKTFDVEDSAFGLIKMKNGASIYLESSWVLNITKPKEIATTLCGTKGGAEADLVREELIYNHARNGQLTEETISRNGAVSYFEGSRVNPGEVEAEQWINAILKGTQPLVKPEQAFTVTKILDAIYKSAQSGKEFFFE